MERGWRVLVREMGIRRARIVENEKRRSWLIRPGHLRGKWKYNTMEKSSKHSRKEEISESKRGANQCGEDANGKTHESGG